MMLGAQLDLTQPNRRSLVHCSITQPSIYSYDDGRMGEGPEN